MGSVMMRRAWTAVEGDRASGEEGCSVLRAQVVLVAAEEVAQGLCSFAGRHPDRPAVHETLAS
jgi:hypothetical protein